MKFHWLHVPSVLLGLSFLAALPEASPVALADPEDVFTSSEQCGICHIGSPAAQAMRDPHGADISPYQLWQGTMMANAFRDPYFRAQLRKESLAAGEEVQQLCLRCHAPMLSHGMAMAGEERPMLKDIDGDPFADDGVSCTVCHMMTAEGFGTEASFSGQPTFNRERLIFGPFEGVTPGPMQNLVNYTPTHGAHVRQSALCATCHTLRTAHQGVGFLEQSPYLEWRNSEFSDESGPSQTSRSCQQCHMAEYPATRLARSPSGSDFRIPERAGYRGHQFVGGNAFVLDILASNRDELDVIAEPQALQSTIEATRHQLAERTASVEIGPITREQGRLAFDVVIANQTGHKFPTGYPARRAWLEVQVSQGGRSLFVSGAPGDAGRIRGLANELAQPHFDLVEKQEQVVVYEMIAQDPAGAATTHLTKMTKRSKDTRLLPRGWKLDGPHSSETAPVGLGEDQDFVGGSDTVHFRIPAPADSAPVTVHAVLHYQSVPPAWVDALRGIAAEECARFVRMYDATTKRHEDVAADTRSEN